MFDTPEAVTRQLAAGEDGFAEFKRVEVQGLRVVAPSAESIAGELVAFANADGGVLFLGVDDDGSVRGILREAADAVDRWIGDIASNSCDPPIRPSIRRMVLPLPSSADSALLLLVEVPRGVFVHRTTSGRWYVRVGASKRDLTTQEVGRLLQQRGRAFVFDEQPVVTSDATALDDALIDRVLGPGATAAIPRRDLLRNMRIVTTDDRGTDHPTVAGLLAFARTPQRELPGAFIDAAVYRGTERDSDDLVHSQRCDGPVDAQIEDAVAFVDRFMLRPARKPLGREDYPQYPLAAVREAVVNAVAHRDYSVGGAKTRLYLFDDRLELYTPGALPNTMTLATLPYRVFTRNQLLVSFLGKLRSPKTGQAYLESRGEGVRRILRQGARWTGKTPAYRLVGDELLLTIWARAAPDALTTDSEPLRVCVTPELARAFADEPTGSGGFQSLLREIRAQVLTGTMELRRDTIERIERYAYDYGSGGWQRALGLVLELVDAARPPQD